MDTAAAKVNRVGSIRRNSSVSVWRRGEVDVFSRSTRDDDDEEALKWAALEKLPTYDRVRKGILSLDDGKRQEVDIQHLGIPEMQNLLARLVRVADEDNERFLLKLLDRIKRVGIDLPTIEVRYENLNIEAEAYVGNRGLPTLLNSVVNQLEALATALHVLPSRKRTVSVLHDVSGFIKPRRLTLLLGPPGSGKTSLLLALAGKLDSDLNVTGRVTYNGSGMDEFVPKRTAAYISQHDLHVGEMTVRETLAFSARCQGVGTRYEMLTELSRREKEANIKPDPDIDVFMKAASMEGQETSVVTDYILKVLGLDICADTMVGDEMLRGISGGQRKRVTTGEMLVGPARALFMDEIFTGLDSSITFQIVKSLKQSIHILSGTGVISLLQPAPETYDLFDDIILLSDGQIVYQACQSLQQHLFSVLPTAIDIPAHLPPTSLISAFPSLTPATASSLATSFIECKLSSPVFHLYQVPSMKTQYHHASRGLHPSPSHPLQLLEQHTTTMPCSLNIYQLTSTLHRGEEESFTIAYKYSQNIVASRPSLAKGLRLESHIQIEAEGSHRDPSGQKASTSSPGALVGILKHHAVFEKYWF